MARDAVFERHEAAQELFFRTAERFHVDACLASASHARKRDHQHFMEIVTGRVAGAGVFHPVEDWCEVLHCPASSLPQVFVFQRGVMQSLRSQDEIFSNAIALPWSPGRIEDSERRRTSPSQSTTLRVTLIRPPRDNNRELPNSMRSIPWYSILAAPPRTAMSPNPAKSTRWNRHVHGSRSGITRNLRAKSIRPARTCPFRRYPGACPCAPLARSG